MKRIFYSEDKTFNLTEKEFKEAAVSWDKSKNYYCKRLEALLSPFFKFADTPEPYNEYEVFLNLDLPSVVPIVKDVDGKFFHWFEDGRHVKLEKSETTSLVAEEEYLNSPEKFLPKPK